MMEQIYMLEEDSKLYQGHPNILQQSTQHSLPIVSPEYSKGLPKERSTQINILLKGLAKEKMIGSIIEEVRSKKYSHGIRKVNSSLGNYNCKQRSPSCNRNHGAVTILQRAFISSYDNGTPARERSKNTPQSSPRRLRLPSINYQKHKLKQVGKSVWDQISVQNRLKKDLLHDFLSKRLCPKVAETFIRFLQPPFQTAQFRFNQFLNGLTKLPDACRQLFEFQLLDLDNDGVISSKDILELYMEITAEEKEDNSEFKAELDRLSVFLKEYLESEQKPTQVRSLFQTVVCDRTTSLSKINVLVDKELKLDGCLKNYVHHSAYKHTFLVFGHNQKMRAKSQLIDKARHHMENLNFRTDKGLTLGIFLQTPTNFSKTITNFFIQEQGSQLL